MGIRKKYICVWLNFKFFFNKMHICRVLKNKYSYKMCFFYYSGSFNVSRTVRIFIATLFKILCFIRNSALLK